MGGHVLCLAFQQECLQTSARLNDKTSLNLQKNLERTQFLKWQIQTAQWFVPVATAAGLSAMLHLAF